MISWQLHTKVKESNYYFTYKQLNYRLLYVNILPNMLINLAVLIDFSWLTWIFYIDNKFSANICNFHLFWDFIPLVLSQENIIFLIFILLKYSWLTMFQVPSKVTSYTIYTYITFEIIFHHRLLPDIDYDSLHYMVNLFCYVTQHLAFQQTLQNIQEVNSWPSLWVKQATLLARNWDGPKNLCGLVSADSEIPESATQYSRQCPPTLGTFLYYIPQWV